MDGNVAYFGLGVISGMVFNILFSLANFLFEKADYYRELRKNLDRKEEEHK